MKIPKIPTMNTKDDIIDDYNADKIEVLEGLEPVRHRPGMYIGGTDEKALHHLVAELLDNAMDEVVSGYANQISISLIDHKTLYLGDNGRGIPIDNHAKYPNKSALEVILTTLHSGGKFSNKAYATSGGLHGVGVSVVNALSETFHIEVIRKGNIYAQDYAKGAPINELTLVDSIRNKKGTHITFSFDQDIFGDNLCFNPSILYHMVRSKAYLFKGVTLKWSNQSTIEKEGIPREEQICFPNGVYDFLQHELQDKTTLLNDIFYGVYEDEQSQQKCEWAIAWLDDDGAFHRYYCNTIPTILGGSHEQALRSALVKSLKTFSELTNTKTAHKMTTDDICKNAIIILNIFTPNPQFQGQTKDKLLSNEAGKFVEQVIKDHFTGWLSQYHQTAQYLLDYVIQQANERTAQSIKKNQQRKSPTKRINFPVKLADCTAKNSEDTELFIVEGDSAGGSAKQARDRKTQAVLPLKGKILNVASASIEKFTQNQEINDLIKTIGAGIGKNFIVDDCRYERIIIMTDADVDGAHIASLLLTFFYQQMPDIIKKKRLFIANPPLFRLSKGSKIYYAQTEEQKDIYIKKYFHKNEKPMISRFKGLGEMPPQQLKETTMNKQTRSLIQVTLNHCEHLPPPALLVEQLMGKKPEKRMAFIKDYANNVAFLDI